MKREKREQRKSELLGCVYTLPKSMVKIHGAENMSEFLLHHLSDVHCFNFHKAAYFVDNPDFNHLKGVVGFQSESAYQEKNPWNSPDQFTHHMKQSDFNQKVRTIARESTKRNNQSDQEIVNELSKVLDLHNPIHRCWPMKYDNHGLLVFELADQNEQELVEEMLNESLYLFAFCPVF